MSRHGPPREPGPPYGPGDYGPPTDPWDAGGPRPGPYEQGGYPPEGYESPGGYGPDPGDHGRGYDRPGYPPPDGHHEADYGDRYQDSRYQDSPYQDAAYQDAAYQDPPYDEPADDPGMTVLPGSAPAGRPRRPVALYAVVTVLVVLAAVGVGYALFLLTGQDGETDPVAVDPSAAPDPGATPDPDSPDFDNTGMNAGMARVDDCLVNDGSAQEPQMRVVSCDAEEEAGQLFRVLEILDEEVAGSGDAANEQAQEICLDTDGYTHHYYEVAESSSFVLCMAEHDPSGDDDADDAGDEESDD